MTADRAPNVNGDGLDDPALVTALQSAVRPHVRPSGNVCAECDAAGGWWVHLRRCASCGHVGCCDTSPEQHATGHYEATGHRLVRSFEPGEDWFWDYGTEQVLEGPHLAAPLSRPPEQESPGPVDRMPANWRELIHA